MKIKVSIEELIDNNCLQTYCNNRDLNIKEIRKKDKEEEVYISGIEAEEWGFMNRSLDLFGGET